MALAQMIETESDDGLVEPRFERIGGTEYAMSAPGYKHQMTVGRIFARLDAQLSKHDCLPIVAPFDVYPLYDQGDEETYVQPDIFTAFDRSKLRENRYNGAPKCIIEILSTNRSHDMITKLNLYQKAGVGEYWMVDPDEKVISVLELSGGSYLYRTFDAKSDVPLVSIPGCSVDFNAVFEGL